MVTIGNPHLQLDTYRSLVLAIHVVYWNYPKLIDQCLNMVCPGWLRLAKPMGDKYSFEDYYKQLCSIDKPVP